MVSHISFLKLEKIFEADFCKFINLVQASHSEEIVKTRKSGHYAFLFIDQVDGLGGLCLQQMETLPHKVITVRNTHPAILQSIYKRKDF